MNKTRRQSRLERGLCPFTPGLPSLPSRATAKAGRLPARFPPRLRGNFRRRSGRVRRSRTGRRCDHAASRARLSGSSRAPSGWGGGGGGGNPGRAGGSLGARLQAARADLPGGGWGKGAPGPGTRATLNRRGSDGGGAASTSTRLGAGPSTPDANGLLGGVDGEGGGRGARPGCSKRALSGRRGTAEGPFGPEGGGAVARIFWPGGVFGYRARPPGTWAGARTTTRAGPDFSLRLGDADRGAQRVGSIGGGGRLLKTGEIEQLRRPGDRRRGRLGPGGRGFVERDPGCAGDGERKPGGWGADCVRSRDSNRSRSQGGGAGDGVWDGTAAHGRASADWALGAWARAGCWKGASWKQPTGPTGFRRRRGRVALSWEAEGSGAQGLPGGEHDEAGGAKGGGPRADTGKYLLARRCPGEKELGGVGDGAGGSGPGEGCPGNPGAETAFSRGEPWCGRILGARWSESEFGAGSQAGSTTGRGRGSTGGGA